MKLVHHSLGIGEGELVKFPDAVSAVPTLVDDEDTGLEAVLDDLVRVIKYALLGGKVGKLHPGVVLRCCKKLRGEILPFKGKMCLGCGKICVLQC